MKIGELAAAGGVTTKTIRFYEGEGLMPEPGRTPTGYRDYSSEHLARLQFIRRAQAAGLSLREAGQILSVHDRGEQPCGHVQAILSERLDQVRAQIAELITLEAHLQTLLDTSRTDQPTSHDDSTVCWIIESNVSVSNDQPLDADPFGHVSEAGSTPAGGGVGR
ncbi:heavy metal-responsive transcriptional regulator [Nocardia farcinica]|uniref:heavy metal-responsive transcriptional regulator n=1 Tax=Nocardia farcinica TaxID=37329 RepID=UPI0022B9D50F|nr:heavy metal-responsive transcriptional regulator [Nocardia farcinica]MCZ9330392.1 heavy metal-responsive transcriptional regulator [Nocardia farcinica]